MHKKECKRQKENYLSFIYRSTLFQHYQEGDSTFFPCFLFISWKNVEIGFDKKYGKM